MELIFTIIILCLQEAVEIKVGWSHYINKFTGAKRRKVLTQDTFYYVPLLSTLKKLLQIKCIREEIKRNSLVSSGCLCDLSDGEIYKNHELFSNYTNCLQIVAYYDEVETCNPLGSYSGKHKLGCIFFSIANIRPAYRSTLNSIFLVAVAKSTTIKENGIDSILKNFIDDLNILSKDGIEVQFDEEKEVWKGGLLAFLADNLASHELGGFKESFSFARRFCRSCLADKNDSQNFFRECEFEIRTPLSHVEHCKLLEGPNGSEASVEYGINRVPLLESVSNFSVINGMPHDIMHDLYEGVIPHELKLLLQHCIGENYFDLDLLNERLQSFDYGYNESGDKPAPLTEVTKIKQTASQMKLFSNILPLLVGDRVPTDNPYWECYNLLLRVCDVCTSSSLTVDSAAYLEHLIEEHHTKFKSLYPNASIIPKMHFMVHYPQQIINYGPLVHTWTMRHEAKLRVLKRAARISNFKNVCQTVAKRHQHLMCLHMHTMYNSGLIKPPETGPLKPYAMSESAFTLLKEYYPSYQNSICYSTSYVSYNGITYKPNAFILHSTNNLECVFLKITTIIKCDLKVFFILSQYDTDYYDSHYHCYCVSEHGNVQLIYDVQSLPYSWVFHVRRNFSQDGKRFIAFKYIDSC